jgi:hypothetical protein
MTLTQRVLDKHEVQVLLDRLCVKLGFCLRPADHLSLIESPPADVKSFTDAVVAFEGLDPATYDRHIYRAVRNMVMAAFDNAKSREIPARDFS